MKERSTWIRCISCEFLIYQTISNNEFITIQDEKRLLFVVLALLIDVWRLTALIRRTRGLEESQWSKTHFVFPKFKLSTKQWVRIKIKPQTNHCVAINATTITKRLRISKPYYLYLNTRDENRLLFFVLALPIAASALAAPMRRTRGPDEPQKTTNHLVFSKFKLSTKQCLRLQTNYCVAFDTTTIT